jgi:hypothetical protein
MNAICLKPNKQMIYYIKKCFALPQIRRGEGAGGRGVVWFGAPQATLSFSLSGKTKLVL